MRPESRRVFLIVPGLLFSFVAIQTASPETGLRTPQEMIRLTRDSITVGANIDGVLAALASVAMKENISRFAGDGAAARKLDSFETEVSIADGVEQYADVRGNHRTYQHVSQIRGLWSFGEVVTMLRTTRDIIDSSSSYWTSLAADPPGGGEASDETVIEFQSPAADHRWFVTSGGRIHWLEFQGAIRISRKSGEIERLTWTSGYGPVGSNVASILWDVNFSAVTIAGNTFTVPSNSIFRVVRKGLDRTVEWNLTRYAALGRYGSTASLRYDQ
jgi:hypothetical protein